jgi:excisionase family DNA binding protein
MQHQKPRYRVEEAFALLGLPRSTGYVAVKDGRLKTQKDGRQTYISARQIDHVKTLDRSTATKPESTRTAQPSA